MGNIFAFTDVFVAFIILIISIFLLIKYTIYVRKRNAQREKTKYLNIKEVPIGAYKRKRRGIFFYYDINYYVYYVYI